MIETSNFEFSPKLIILLGEQLIHDKKIALSELIKNSYDADADEVKIYVNENQIIIKDDGFGMTKNVVDKYWLKPGVSSKTNNELYDKLTPKHKRAPIGEKGIGRLSCHKLGHQIELFSKAENSDEIHFCIDWKEFENSDTIDSYKVKVQKNSEPIVFKNGETGTKIIISELKEEWSEKDMGKLSSELLGLISPFQSIEHFNIKLYRDDLLFKTDFKEEASKILAGALFKFSIVIKDGKIEKFSYLFSPWRGFEKVKPRVVSLEKDKFLLDKILSKKFFTLSIDNTDNSLIKIGEIKFEGVLYDFDNILWKNQHQFSRKEKTEIKRYLKDNGGIRVFKDNLRVFNYGEPGNQLVELDSKRVNRPSENISSNQILASIVLDRKNSNKLIEKSNREGFIHNEAFKLLHNYLLDIIYVISIMWKDDKEKLKSMYAQKEYDRVKIEKDINEMMEIINQSELIDTDKKRLNEYFKKFISDFDDIKQIFLNASQNGISLSLVVHELDKIIKVIDREINKKNWSFVISNFTRLSHIVNLYKDVIKLDKTQKKVMVRDLIDVEITIMELRFDYHGIKFIYELEENIEILVKKNLILGTISNLIDNSIYWLNYHNIDNKKILIKAYKKEDEVHLVVADNGKGFTMSFESSLRPFISGRPDESSMGMGLFMAKQVMEAHQGFIILGDYVEEGLGDDFADGAVIKLIFREVA